MTHPEFPIEPFRSLNEMFSQLGLQEGLEQTLDRTVKLAVDGVPGCDEGSLALVDDGGVKTLVATTDAVIEADRAQYRTGEGPCVEAIRAGETFAVRDMAQEDRWPEFVAASLKQEFRSSLSVPLKVEARTIGAFNLYSHSLDAFQDDERMIASLFVSRAAIGIAHADLWKRYEITLKQLETALESRDLIGQAKGILMEREGIDDDQAFAMLRQVSQETNIKLRDIAARVVREGADNRTPSNR